MLIRNSAFFILALTCWFSGAAESKRVLFLAPLGSKSHKIFFMAIAESLAKRGHHVTMLSAYKPFKNIPNIREVVLDNFNLDEILNSAFDRPESAIMKLIMDSPEMCSNTLQESKVQDLKKEKFDLIIVSFFMNFCYLSFVDHFKVSFIYAMSAGLFGPFSVMMNNPDFPSFCPHKMLEMDYPLTFTDRLKSTLLNSLMEPAVHYTISKSMSVCKERKLCREEMPSFQEINKNLSLVVINSVRTMEKPPKAAMPHVIYGGAAHIKPAKKLPEDLEKWASGSGKDGFIFFSLGSAMNPAHMPARYLSVLLKVFGSLKQKVLMKWHEEKMPGLPSNVKLGKWLPQQDILGHKNIKLFITHGGFSSTQEAMFNNVPILGMPIFADQFANLKEAKREGWCNIVKWGQLEENLLRNTILETINNQSMKEMLGVRSAIMKDVPIPPDEEIAFWIEYVMRHDGAPHLRSPIANMSWIALYNIDVWCLLGVMFGLSIYLSVALTKFVFRRCFSRTEGKVSQSKKKK